MLSAQVINELRNLSKADPLFLKNLFGIFLSTLTERLSDLERAIVMHDSEKVARLAHGLKGSCFNLGAQKMGEFCQELELFGRRNSLSEAPLLFHRLFAEAELVILEMKKLPELQNL